MVLRAPEASEIDALQLVWDASFRDDDPGGFFSGGWSVSAWATQTRVLLVDDHVVGVVAVRAETAPDGAMPARVALDPPMRTANLTARLVEGVIEVVAESGGALARQFIAGGAEWLQPTAHAAGFEYVRTIAHMLLPASAPTPPAKPPDGWRVRTMESGEDARVLAALNRAWTGTWNLVEITPEMLDADLHGQREGMLLGVVGDALRAPDGSLREPRDRIIATCHAMFDPDDRNMDGAPRAWISNLTVDPDFRSRGVARTMLAAGIAHLRSRGATSVSLGVDADDPAPFRLYQSVGFEITSRLEAWDAPVTPTGRRP